MTGGSPFGLGFGFGTMPMPGPVDSDPGQMQLDEEQRRLIAQRLLGAQMFHPGNNPAVMSALADQDQDQGPGPGPGGGQGALAQAPSVPSFVSPLARAMSLPNAGPDDVAAFVRRAPYDASDAPQMLRTASPAPPDGAPVQGGPQPQPGPGLSSLASALRGAPSMSAGQMPPPQMPAAPQPSEPQPDAQQQGSPTLPAGIPTMIGAAFPQMGQAGGPQVTGAIPQRAPQIAQAQPPQATAQGPVGDDEDAAPAAPAARAVPTPPVRPSDLSSVGALSQVNSFDPLTGQPVSGTPRPMGAPAPIGPQGAPQGGPAPAAAGGGQNDQSFVKAWQRLADSGIGDQLLAMSAGAFQGRTLGESLGKGLQNMLAVKQAAGTGDMQKLEYALKVQKAQQEQNTLTSNANFAKSIFAKNGQNISDQQALAFGGNPTVMNDLLKGILPPTEQYTQYTDEHGNRMSRNQRTGQEALVYKGEEDKTQTPLLTPEDRAAAGIKPEDTRTAWIDPNKKVTFNDGPTETAAIKEYQRAVREDGYKGTLLQWKQDQAMAGRNQTTINMPPAEMSRDKKIGDAVGTDIADYISAARPARDKMAALNILEDAWKTGGDKITTGPMAERVLSLKQFARGTLGMQIGDDVSPSELISKIGTQLATADAKSLTARPTQFDFATYLKNNPGLTLTPEGNAALIAIKKQQAQHEIDLAALARKKDNWDNWDDVVAGYDKAHPIVSPLTGKPLGAANVDFPGASGASQGTGQGGQPRQDAPARPPQGAPASARQAPDGNWYVSDPDRPGKYLKVQ